MGARFALWTLGAGFTLWTLFALGACIAFFSLGTLGTLRTGFALGTLRTLGTGCTDKNLPRNLTVQFIFCIFNRGFNGIGILHKFSRDNAIH